MATLLDTDLIPPEDRVDALRGVLATAIGPTRLDVSPDAQGVLQMWELGFAIRLLEFSVTADRLRIVRETRRLHDPVGEFFSVAVNEGDRCTPLSHGLRVVDNGQIHPVDVTTGYEIDYRGGVRTVVCEVDYTMLGLTVDTVRASMPRLVQSPLHTLLRCHLTGLAESVDELSIEARTDVGYATVDLVRAAVQSMSPRGQDRKGSLAETLPLRIDEYVWRNLGIPS